MTRPGGPNTLLQTINIFRTGTYRENENATVTEKKLIRLNALSPAARPASPSNRSAQTRILPIRVRAQRFLSYVSGAIREVRCRSPSGPHANLQAVAASVLHRLDKKLAWEAA
jgi:hypothetical protein